MRHRQGFRQCGRAIVTDRVVEEMERGDRLVSLLMHPMTITQHDTCQLAIQAITPRRVSPALTEDATLVLQTA